MRAQDPELENSRIKEFGVSDRYTEKLREILKGSFMDVLSRLFWMREPFIRVPPSTLT